MNIEFYHRIPWIPLGLLWLAYALLGWYLAVHHIVWLVGGFIAAVALAIARKSFSWLERLINFGSQTLIVVLFLSLSIAIVATWSLLFSLFLIPVATTLLADLELRFAGFTKLDAFLVLTILAVLGLAVGETIDILLLPSSRL
ncbi:MULTISPECIES: hypothetical protein [unclassified Tolypothrix]|uniref:hypothetical protein n=1 Tax=unclassified Tolypothrix TaxID=2649714 RepID=UPI0005EAC6EE|nr:MULTISPECIES: hypothetical protein [unclassified Tolypothrix]BAY93202.1 hypothetical protein NIES3275_52400 [Microchaete diplosiphon NIES-3275]EKF00217.1 hypothetical protein FDUTEX481_09147 [Tolypothrix sp. PCC 7601]MBE9082962.1 hypothetical protein [Tolypothrix sp. LEGE 11397]UYD27077.1 hypothetical protein HGR01_02910 [Tolypothrix sp. PCC 7712]UYD37065.1 hypothetical protein HG267_15865 [Tolypothrix sp. PCC 7601]